ncbi:MAG: glycosyltransferase family 4 protein [Terriglobia bacterium]|nr:glycosyltransferase family 4 protein [Terriglobia bacterium]
MKILWLSHFVPYPPKGGNLQRSYNLLRELSREHEVTLVAFNMENHPPDRLAAYKEQLRKFCREVAFWQLPVRWRGLRWWLQMAASPLRAMPHACSSFWSKETQGQWQAILQRNWSVVHFDSPDLAHFVASSAHFPRVLNHHNCESRMMYRRAELEPSAVKRLFLKDQAQKLRALESTLCGQCDINLTVSESDAEQLRKHSPDGLFHIVENGTDCSYFSPQEELESSNSIVFAGSLNWYPNQTALRFFGEQVWPILKKRHPGIRLYVAGMSPARWIFDWAAKDGSTEVIASPEDIRPWIHRAAVFVCPIQDGGGTKLKILDALAMGKAVVSTTFATEGLRVVPGEHLLVADSAADFAEATAQLLSDSSIRKKIGCAGRQFVEAEYSWTSIGRELTDAYKKAIRNFENDHSKSQVMG